GEPTILAQLSCNRCMAHLALEDHVAALRDAKAAVASAPGWPKSHFRHAQVLTARGAYMEAYGAFKQAWHLDPKNQELVVACQRAYELMVSKDKERAQAYAQKVSQARRAGEVDSVKDSSPQETAEEVSDSGIQENRPPAEVPTGVSVLTEDVAKTGTARSTRDVDACAMSKDEMQEDLRADLPAPEHCIERRDCETKLTVWLPLVEDMSSIGVNLSSKSVLVEAAGLYAALALDLPFEVLDMAAKARFDKRARKLVLSLPHAHAQDAGMLV
ncbi:MAG: hypothetical protein SGPRY_010310, partial [Prymnesium sp.]